MSRKQSDLSIRMKEYEAAFDVTLPKRMQAQNAVCAYVQSDEITVMMTPYQRFSTMPWLANRVSKITSISASVATLEFNDSMTTDRKYAMFDSRVFVVPREDALNIFVERQKDCIRNSILGYAQFHYSKKSIMGKSCRQLLEQLEEDGHDWNDCEDWQKRGYFLSFSEGGRLIVEPAPDFIQEKDVIHDLVYPMHEEGRE